MNQKTINESITLTGTGVHSGEESSICIKPAAPKHGIKFIRTDIVDAPIIAADVNNVSTTLRGTSLSKNNVTIHTVEHLLAACYACGIDNLLIEVSGSEIPIMDGSAKPFITALNQVGFDDQSDSKEIFRIQENIHFVDNETGSEYYALPDDKLDITAFLTFENNSSYNQFASLQDLSNFEDEIASAKTFVFANDLESLLEKGLIKGGSIANAIVIVNGDLGMEQMDKLSKKFNLDLSSEVGKGILNKSALTFTNEPARHKLLDLIGDLSLVGKPIHGKIIANKPGHKSNIAFAKILKQKYLEQRKLKGKPDYNPNVEPIFDVNGIQGFLPHRYPFLLVDKIIELSETKVVGIKNISFNESYFQGHFPGNPVFPGVLQMEALAQTGGILALNTVEEPQKWDTYFIKMDNVKFKSKVVPGDTLILKMELLSPIRRGIVHMQGTAYVGNRIVSEGELTAQIIKAR